MNGCPLVLASSSRYRLAVLEQAGIDVDVRPSGFDERGLDEWFATWGVDRYVVEVALGKARAVAAGLGGGVVLAADQVAVLDGELLTKPGTHDRAVEQLLAMSGRTHDLVNGIVVVAAPNGPEFSAVDRHRVTMARYGRAEAAAYVERFAPLDCVGAYRVEDDAGLIAELEGSGDDGVIGMPVGVVRDLLARVGVGRGGD